MNVLRHPFLLCALLLPALAHADPAGMPMDMPMPAAPATKAKPKPATPAHVGHHHPAADVTPQPASASPATAGPAASAAPTHHHGAMAMDPAMGPMPMDHGIDDPPAAHAASSPPATNAPRTPIPVPTAADRAAAFPPVTMPPMHDDTFHHVILFDRLEAGSRDGQAWEAQAWFGTDLDRLWLRSEGERRQGRTEAADLELLYGRSVSTWWDVLAGWRHDQRPGGAEDFVALGVQGTLPYKIELAATGYVGSGGQTAARVEADYQLPLGRGWFVQPRVEVDLYGRDDPARRIGSGLSSLAMGLRLRYEIDRRFAPYVGVESERSFGATAGYRRAVGEAAASTRVVAGIRFWF